MNVLGLNAYHGDVSAALVRDGMGLMIFTGAKLDVGLYNDLLYRPDRRILPCSMKSLVDENIRGLIVEPLSPSPLARSVEDAADQRAQVPARLEIMVRPPYRINQSRQPGQVAEQDAATVVRSERRQPPVSTPGAPAAEVAGKGEADDVHNP